jgi:hypothetical protein
MNALEKARAQGTSDAIEKFAANALMRHMAAKGNAGAQAVNRGVGPGASPQAIDAMRNRKQNLMGQQGVAPGGAPQTGMHQKPGGAQAPQQPQPGQPSFMSQVAQQAIPTAMMIGAPMLMDKVMGGSKQPAEDPYAL